MERNEVFKEVQEVFYDVFGNLDIEITDETTSDDIEAWDSLSHVQLTESIQEKFGIKFTAYEISSWIDVGELVDCIVSKLK